MKTRRFLCALGAASLLLPFGVAGTAPTVENRGVASQSAGEVGQAPARPGDGSAGKLQALKGTFTVNGGVDAVAITDEAVWAIVAVPQRQLPTHALVRSDIASGRAVDLGTIGGFIGGALAIAEGSVWAAEGFGGEKIHRIDPATGKIIASIAVPRNPTGLVHGAGAIWVTASEKAGKAGGLLLSVSGLALFRIDPVTNRIVASVPIPTAQAPGNMPPSAMLAFASGAVWSGDSLNGTVVRIDPATDRIVATIEAPQTDTVDLRRHYSLHPIGDRLLLRRYGYKGGRGADAGVITDVTAWQIDPSTNRITGEAAHLAGEGTILTVVDGVGWLGSTRADGLVRVDLTTLRPLAPPLFVGHPVYTIAGGGGSLLAIAGARRTAGDDRPTSWITRVAP